MHLSDLTHSFEFVDSISVERNDSGLIDIKMPQIRYDKSSKYPVHQYGWGPFCRFSADTSGYVESEGVYIFTAGYEIKYVGETVNLHNRIQSGYGNISPKNCFEGGQQTNCRINNLILETVRSRNQVSLWFEETQDRKGRETELIEQCGPPWNQTSTRTPSATTHQPTPEESPSQTNESPNMETSDLENRFDWVGSASIELDKDGQIDVKHPHKRYSKSDEKELHPDGEGPYCEFNFNTSDYEGSEGVFIFTVDEEIKYIGETSDIDHYIRQIGKVSPSACYENGQQTVCRINTKIFYAASDGGRVSLWAAKSSNANSLKKQLVDRFHPSWNHR